MPKRQNYGWKHVGKPGDAQRARLEAINARIDEMCRYQRQCLQFADNAGRLIERLKDEQLELVKTLGGAPEEKTG